MQPMKFLAVSAVLVGVAAPAAALQQPNGATIPSAPGCNGGKPTGLTAAFACVCTMPGICNIGGPCASMTSCDDGKHGTCETTMWHNFNDNTCIPSNHSGLDTAAEAKLTPETYHPTCSLTFTVVTRGDALFKDAFGWYNVTGHKPDPSDLHVMLDCTTTPGQAAVLDVKNHPDYKGGEIGFFLVTPENRAQRSTCAGGNCCATVARASAATPEGYVYYSERTYNPDNTGPSSYIHLVIYDSHLVKRKFYFAWEDIFGGSNNTFTDLVTSVEGVECSGGGSPCDTGKAGVCKNGITQCENGVNSCTALYMPEPERCDGLDNDCNGAIDDGASCPEAGQVCHNGECVGHCAQASEFACGLLSCDAATGLCMDPACAGVTCPADQTCRGGACVGPCDGIVCPHGSVCRLGSCIDPCKHVGCPDGKVCAEGLCVAACNQCGGLTCSDGTQCDPMSGACVDPSCQGGCQNGFYCDHGACKDACGGAACPHGRQCAGGECLPPGVAPDGGGGKTDQPPIGSAGGCGCDQRSRSGTTQGSFALGFLLFALSRLRRS